MKKIYKPEFIIYNMNKGDKRGISDIVTTVLLVLLAIAAVGIIWVVIQNFIIGGTAGVGTASDCLQNNFEVVSAVNVSNSSTSLVNVTVKSIGPGQDTIDKLVFYYTAAGQTTKKSDSTNVPGIGESKTFTVTTVTSPNTIKSGDSVKVAAVIGGQTCSSTEAKTITGL